MNKYAHKSGLLLMLEVFLAVLFLLPVVHAEEKPEAVTKTIPSELTGVVLDHLSRQELAGSTVKFLVDGEVVEQQTVQDNGRFAFAFDYKDGSTYQLKAKHGVYLEESVDLSLALAKKRLPEQIEISLAQQESSFSFRGNILDRDTKKPVSNIRILLVNKRSGEISKLTSDYRGDFAFKVVSGYEYDLVFDHVYYLARYAQVNYCSDTLAADQKYCFSGFFRPALDSAGRLVSASVLVDRVEIGKKFTVKDINYDYNEASLRDDAFPSLRKLHHILKDNPQLVVELSSHTDSRGSDNYNFDLSQRRADSVVNYLIEKDVSVYRMAAKGYGEVDLLNECKDGVKCSDGEHEQNRRTEFVVLDIDESAFVE